MFLRPERQLIQINLHGGQIIFSKAIKDKQYLYLHFKFTQSPLDYAKYASQRSHVKFMISAKVKYDELMMQNFKSNLKMLYSYVRR